MEMFLSALGLLAVTVCLSACLSLHPVASARWTNSIGSGGCLGSCLLGLCALFTAPWGTMELHTLPWGLPFGTGQLALDDLGRIFLLPVFGLGALCSLSGCAALRHYPAQDHNFGAHWCFFALLLLALSLVFAAHDAVFFLFSWELMSISPFFLIEFNDNEVQVREASWIYLVAAHLGAVFLLAFFALLIQETGETSFRAFQNLLNTACPSLLFLTALLGFGAKAGLAPLHVWLPEAHPAAPSHISAMLSGAMINAGIYGLLRTLTFFGPLEAAPAWWGWTLLFLGLGTGLLGILKALAQANLKRLLAYSSVENMGILLMGAGLGLVCLKNGQAGIAALGFAACLFHMLNHAAFKGLLFLCSGEILHSVHTVRMDLLGGLQKRMPPVGICFAAGAVAITCLPPLNGFSSELLLVLGLAKGGTTLPALECRLGLPAALAGLALISGLAVAAFAKAYGTCFLGEARTGAAAQAQTPDAVPLACLLLPAAVCLAVGLLPQYVLEYIAPAAARLAGTISTNLPALQTGSDILATAAALGLLGGALTLFLALPRIFRRNQVRSMPTWGCGYQALSPRIQYTGASFVEPLVKIFNAVMGVQRQEHIEDTLFPHRGTLNLQAPDRLRLHLFTPLFEAIRRGCDALKIVQHGRIHLYILYMLSTLIVLLVWGLHA